MNNVQKILKDAKNIVIIGASNNESKAAHRVPKYLIDEGYNVIPVNPFSENVLGQKTYKSIADVPKDINIDIVNIFRPSKAIPALMPDILSRIKEVKDVKLVWLQEGIHDKNAKKDTKELGVEYTEMVCILKVHQIF